MKLKSKTVISYKGEVVDLCVQNSHTYNVEGVAVHNSGGGSLVAYVLYITDMDPLKWDLPFARFLSIYRKGAPDIDCVHEDHFVVMADGSFRRAGSVCVGDIVLGGDCQPHRVTAVYSRSLRPYEDAVWVRVRADDLLGHMVVVPGHKFIKADGEIVYCRDLQQGDKLMASTLVEVVCLERGGWGSSTGQYVDITVDDDHRFHVVPFDITVKDDGEITHDIGYGDGSIVGVC